MGYLVRVIATLVLILPVYAFAYQKQLTLPEEAQKCLGCHESRDMMKTMSDGSRISIYVDARGFLDSVHSGLGCTGCHQGYLPEGHVPIEFKNIRTFKAAASNVCKGCHLLSGAHERMLGGLKDALCVDCHGAHSIRPAAEAEPCLGCHRNNIKLGFANGQSVFVKIEPSEIRNSVHSKLRCYDCHFGFSAEEHPQMRFKSRRDLTIFASDSCRRCHFDKYTKTLESIHYDILSRGNLSAPVCVDCHGSHGISSGRKEKVLSAKKCQRCHEGIYDIYVRSVHGSALISEHNKDVPVCSDCHRAHDLADPHSTDFRNRTPEMCGQCHANESLMAKYGLSTAVLQSYLEDFHGVTVTFYKKQKNAPRHIAVCTDCHGIHDITKVKGPNATVLKSNLLPRCKKCHPSATENFPDAWISHYDPTFRRAPLVYAVMITYKLFIPFMVVGLVLQIILHIWRYAVNR